MYKKVIFVSYSLKFSSEKIVFSVFMSARNVSAFFTLLNFVYWVNIMLVFPTLNCQRLY